MAFKMFVFSDILSASIFEYEFIIYSTHISDITIFYERD